MNTRVVHNDDVLENIPYPKGLFNDNRVSSWYINVDTFALYRMKDNTFIKTTHPIPQFVSGERNNRLLNEPPVDY